MCDCQCDFVDKYAPLGTYNSWIFDASEARYVIGFNNSTAFQRFDSVNETFFGMGAPGSGTRIANQTALPMREGVQASGSGFTTVGSMPNLYCWGNSPLRNAKYDFFHAFFFTIGGPGVTSGTIKFKAYASPTVNGFTEFAGVTYPPELITLRGDGSAPYTANWDIPCNNKMLYSADFQAFIFASQDGTLGQIITPPIWGAAGDPYPMDQVSYIDDSVIVSRGRIFEVTSGVYDPTELPVVGGFTALAHTDTHVFGDGASFALGSPGTVLRIPDGESCIGYGGEKFLVFVSGTINNRSQYKVYDAITMDLLQTFYARAIFTAEEDYIIGVDITTDSAKANQNDLVMVVDFDDVETNLLQVIAPTTFTQSNAYRELAWANGCLYGRGAWSISYP